MQTFLPYPDAEQSAASLDNKRLNAQRREGLECLYLITGLPLYSLYPALKNLDRVTGAGTPTPNHKTQHWNHPIRKMWQGYPAYLAHFGLTCCMEWVDRGFKDDFGYLGKFLEVIQWKSLDVEGPNWIAPPWWGDPKVHDTYKANLVFKLPSLYGMDWPDVEPIEERYYAPQTVPDPVPWLG